MKSLMIALAVLLGCVATVSADEISKSTLSEMGFGNATVMSDVDGLAVRGKGTSASVFGASIANFNNQYGDSSATNGYEAAAHHYTGSSLAKGENKSFAGNKNSEWFSKNFSGGSSKAYAR